VSRPSFITPTTPSPPSGVLGSATPSLTSPKIWLRSPSLLLCCR
jgi:hypothetical protein